MARRKRIRRTVRIPSEYLAVLEFGGSLFPPLYQFENGLRLIVHRHLVTCYGADWWERSLRFKLPKTYKYAEEQRQRRSAMPWIGDGVGVTVLDVHLITLGQLEEIVRSYRSDCIPHLFPTIEFFLGHMECIKRVRNLYVHMFPCLTAADASLVRREMLTLSAHVNARL